jgi:hypothetical protein
MSGNGWRHGFDPIQRWLRVLTTLVVLGVFVYLVVGDARPDRDLPTLALALGAVLTLLGYEGVVHLPFLGGKEDDHDRRRGS